jgi:hypothetical protein
MLAAPAAGRGGARSVAGERTRRRVARGLALAGAAAAAARPRIAEVKRKLDGSCKRYELELWRFEPREAVVARWVAPPGNPYALPAGAVSWGVWPLAADALWGCYRIHGADGRVRAYRFDALERTSCDGLRVEYHDLLLDALVAPGAQPLVQWEDEDEVRDAMRAGALSAQQIARLNDFRALFTASAADVLREVDRLIGPHAPTS